MSSFLRSAALASAFIAFGSGSGIAQELQIPLADSVPAREQFLAIVIAAMMFCGVVSFFLLGRVSDRTHVALAMLSTLAGAFGLLVLFGEVLYHSPLAAVFGLLLLIGLFKLMSQFEGTQKGNRKSDGAVTGRLRDAARAFASRFRA